MKRTFALAVCVAMGGSVALADMLAPADVTYGDYGAVEQSLTGTPGDPENGAQVFVARKLGNCLACHANSDMADQPFHGEVGPPLDGIGGYRTEAELRGMIINSKKTFQGTIMPAFYAADDFTRNQDKFEGETILTAQQVEDVVAYLMTLTD